MKVERVGGRKGHDTVLVDGAALHSAYNPIIESERTLDEWESLLRSNRAFPECIVLIVGEGIPFTAEAALRRWPEIRVIGLEIGQWPIEHPRYTSIALQAVRTDSPLANVRANVRAKVRESIHPLDIGRVSVHVWEPARRLAPDTIHEAELAIAAAIRDLGSELATLGSFGRMWLSNAIHAVQYDTRAELKAQGASATLVTSGPSGEWVLGGQARGVIASSSGLRSLVARARVPAAVVHTDGGFWAKRYLRDTFPGNTNPLSMAPAAVPLVFPVRAALPHRLPAAFYPSPIATGGIEDALHIDAKDWMTIPDQPSVSLTMIDWITRLHPSAAIQLVGFDLGSYGLQSHARPHENDRYIAQRSSRMNPETSQLADRTWPAPAAKEGWPDGRPMYRSAALEAFAGPLKHLLSQRQSPSKRCWAHHDLSTEGGMDPLTIEIKDVARPARRVRVQHAIRTLERWSGLCESTDSDARTLRLYLAPLETMAAERGERPGGDVGAAARLAIARLRQKVDAIGA